MIIVTSDRNFAFDSKDFLFMQKYAANQLTMGIDGGRTYTVVYPSIDERDIEFENIVKILLDA